MIEKFHTACGWKHRHASDCRFAVISRTTTAALSERKSRLTADWSTRRIAACRPSVMELLLQLSGRVTPVCTLTESWESLSLMLSPQSCKLLQQSFARDCPAWIWSAWPERCLLSLGYHSSSYYYSSVVEEADLATCLLKCMYPSKCRLAVSPGTATKTSW